MKKLLTLLLITTLTIATVTGCGKKEPVTSQDTTQQTTQSQDSQASEGTGTDSTTVATTTVTSTQNLSAEDLKQIYMDFLHGNITMVESNSGSFWLEEGKEYTFEEMCNTAIEGNENSYIENAYYAFIDCGVDGRPELAVNIQLQTEWSMADMYLVFSYLDGKVKCVADYEGFYRTEVSLNEYGYVVSRGSSGYYIHGSSEDMINANGERVELYSLTMYMGLGEAYIEDYFIPEEIRGDDYREAVFADNDDYITTECYYLWPGHVPDENEPETKPIFTFYSSDGSYVEPEADRDAIYKKANLEILTYEEVEKRVADHIASLGVTDEIKNGNTPEWKNLIDEGIGSYESKASEPTGLMKLLNGKWKMADNTYSNDIASIYLAIDENGEYKLDINYTDSYTAPGCIRGHLTFTSEWGSVYDANQIGFYVEESNVNDVKAGWFMGTYGLESYRYNSQEATMRLYGLGDSLLERANTAEYPTFVKEYKNVADSNKYYMLSNPGENYCYYGDSTDAVSPIKLNQTSCTENEVIDDDVWFNRIGTQHHGTQWSDDNYTYRLGGTEGYGTITMLYIYSKSTGELIKAYDFHDFEYAPGYDGADFVSRSIRYAAIVDNILYVNLYHRTYADTCPENAYIMAINMDYNSVIWKTEPLVCNSDNFIINGDNIIAGYGFTAEDHYLTLINRKNGSLMKKITVKKSPEYFYLNGNTLYVRTYSYDYEFNVQ